MKTYITHPSIRHPRAIDAAIKLSSRLDRHDRVLWWALHTLLAGIEDGNRDLIPYYQSICNELCNRHYALVKYMANLASNGMAPEARIWYDQYLSACNCALLMAVNRFDPWRKVKFSTYACRAMWQHMYRSTRHEVKHQGIDCHQDYDNGLGHFHHTTGEASPMSILMESEAHEHLGCILRSLSEEDRLVVEWTMAGRTTSDIGRQIGRTHSAVTMRWNKIRERMRLELIERGVA